MPERWAHARAVGGLGPSEAAPGVAGHAGLRSPTAGPCDGDGRSCAVQLPDLRTFCGGEQRRRGRGGRAERQMAKRADEGGGGGGGAGRPTDWGGWGIALRGGVV